jgi:AraC-like DNA-binding protein
MEALSIGEQENDIDILAESYYLLARGYMDLHERGKSHEYIVKAERTAKQSGNGELRCSILNLKGVIKFLAQEKDSALYYYRKAYETGRAEGVDSIHFPRIISNIGECYLESDRAQAYKYFNEALTLARKTDNRIAEASVTSIIGHALLDDNKTKEAETHLHSALTLARTLGLRRVMRHVYAGLVDIKLKQGRGDEAVKYLQQYYAVRDSLLNSSKIRQIVELEAKHTLALKEQNLQILENEKRIATLWNNLLISLIIISTGIYFAQRYRYRKNREMLNLEIDYLTSKGKVPNNKQEVQLVSEVDEPHESYDQKLLKKAIEVVENHIADSQFGVEKMAEEMSMSRTSLHRKIKTITGFPPSELIRNIRLRKAARLILHKVDSASQIALLVGFEDYSHFSKAFKKHFGVAPSGYEAFHNGQHESPAREHMESA